MERDEKEKMLRRMRADAKAMSSFPRGLQPGQWTTIPLGKKAKKKNGNGAVKHIVYPHGKANDDMIDYIMQLKDVADDDPY